jgi:hypothetical protein
VAEHLRALLIYVDYNSVVARPIWIPSLDERFRGSMCLGSVHTIRQGASWASVALVGMPGGAREGNKKGRITTTIQPKTTTIRCIVRQTSTRMLPCGLTGGHKKDMPTATCAKRRASRNKAMDVSLNE